MLRIHTRKIWSPEHNLGKFALPPPLATYHTNQITISPEILVYINHSQAVLLPFHNSHISIPVRVCLLFLLCTLLANKKKTAVPSLLAFDPAGTWSFHAPPTALPLSFRRMYRSKEHSRKPKPIPENYPNNKTLARACRAAPTTSNKFCSRKGKETATASPEFKGKSRANRP